MDKIKVNQTGGYPLTTNTLNSMQNAYSIFNSLGELAGNYSIISGCDQIGKTVTPGIIFLDGEIYPFKGGTKTSKIRIFEDIEKKQFEDGKTKEVLFKRFLGFGTGTGAIEWAKFKRHYRATEPLHKEIKYIGAAIAKEDLPLNWHIADGTNGTDNLTDLFVKGTTNPNQIGVSGSDKITLRASNIPELDVKLKAGVQGRIEVIGSSEITGFVYVEEGNTGLAKVGNPNPTAITINPKHFKVIVIQYIKPQ